MTVNCRALGDVLSAERGLSWTKAYYLKGGPPWSSDTPCAVLDEDEASDSADELRTLGMKHVLDVQEVRGVIMNLRHRTKSPTIVEIVEAVEFYYLNDAYIVY